MNASDNIPLAMVRDDLNDLPRFDAPAGFHLRGYQTGDDAHWVRVHERADRYNAVNLASFEKQFGTSTDELASRQVYLMTSSGDVIGTASAWFGDDEWGRDWGRVHWVAIVPEFQGRGLARPMLAEVLWRLSDVGHSKAYLITSSARIPAIRLYKSFGFQGHPRTDQERDVWEELNRNKPLDPRNV